MKAMRDGNLRIWFAMFCVILAILSGAWRGFQDGRNCFASNNIHIVFANFKQLCRLYPNGEALYLPSTND